MKTNNKAMNINDFVYLMLATLANNSQIIDLNNSDKKYACIPANYKQIIENILCADNRWKEEFAVLINIDEYFEDHFLWEIKLATTINKTLTDLNKNLEYNFEQDKLLISFTQSEIDMIINKYRDEEIKNRMDHFTNLLVDYIYTREFQEEFYDYSASSVKKMHAIRESFYQQKYYSTMGDSFSDYAKSMSETNNIPIINAKEIKNTDEKNKVHKRILSIFKPNKKSN